MENRVSQSRVRRQFLALVPLQAPQTQLCKQTSCVYVWVRERILHQDIEISYLFLTFDSRTALPTTQFLRQNNKNNSNNKNKQRIYTGWHRKIHKARGRHTPFISYIHSSQSQRIRGHTHKPDRHLARHTSPHAQLGWSQVPSPQMRKSFPPTPSHPCLKLEPQTLTFYEPLVLSG